MSRQVTVHKKAAARYIYLKKDCSPKYKNSRTENDQLNLKLGKRSEQTDHQRKDRGHKQVYKDAPCCVTKELQNQIRHSYITILIARMRKTEFTDECVE